MQVIINLFMIPDFWLSLVLQGIQEINFLRNREFINLATLCGTSKVLSFILDGVSGNGCYYRQQTGRRKTSKVSYLISY